MEFVFIPMTGTRENVVRSNAGDAEDAVWWRIDKGRNVWHCSREFNLSFRSRAFRISAPKIWNSLPPHILHFQTLSSFRRHLKTHYFHSAYPAP